MSAELNSGALASAETVSVEAFKSLQAEVEALKKSNVETNLKCNALLQKYQELVSASLQNFNLYQERISIIQEGVKFLHQSLTNLEKRVNVIAAPAAEPSTTSTPGSPETSSIQPSEFKRVTADLYQLIENMKSGNEQEKVSIASIKDTMKREITSQFVGELEKVRQHQALMQKEVGQLKTQVYNFQSVDTMSLKGDVSGIQTSQKTVPSPDSLPEIKRQLDSIKKRLKVLTASPLSDPQTASEEVRKIVDASLGEFGTKFAHLEDQVASQQAAVIRHVVESVRRLIAVDRSLYAEVNRIDATSNEKVLIRVNVQEGAEIGEVAKSALAKHPRVKITIPANTKVLWNNWISVQGGETLSIEGESSSTSIIQMNAQNSWKGERDPSRAVVDGFGSLSISSLKIEAALKDGRPMNEGDVRGLFVIQKSDKQGPGIIVISNCDVDTDEDLVYVGSSAFGWIGISTISMTNSNWSGGHIAHPIEICSQWNSPNGFALVSQKAVNLCGEGVVWSDHQSLLRSGA